MNRLQPHPQNTSPQQRPILRAFGTGVAICLLGVALFVQTGSVLFVFGGAAIGAIMTFNGLKSRHRAPKAKAQAAKPAASRSAPARNFAEPASRDKNASNVTPFRRPASKNTDHKSNRPSA